MGNMRYELTEDMRIIDKEYDSDLTSTFNGNELLRQNLYIIIATLNDKDMENKSLRGTVKKLRKTQTTLEGKISRQKEQLRKMQGKCEGDKMPLLTDNYKALNGIIKKVDITYTDQVGANGRNCVFEMVLELEEGIGAMVRFNPLKVPSILKILDSDNLQGLVGKPIKTYGDNEVTHITHLLNGKCYEDWIKTDNGIYYGSMWSAIR